MSGRERKLSSKETKCLCAILEVERVGEWGSYDGIVLLLQGDGTLVRFARMETFGCLLSLSSRRGKALLRRLVRFAYLEEFSPYPHTRVYLKLTPLGKEVAEARLAKGIRRKEKAPDMPLFIGRNE
ncbi:MAG: hypothetical protein IJS37_00315 [Bacilli bacterium]|nr:hypothetical protein [Bacilli bacterium]